MAESFAAQIIGYHEASKHHFRAYAPGPGYLDWATQPDPFRRYAGAPVIPLARPAPSGGPPYAAGFTPGLAPAASLDYASISQLFFDTLAISAWKEHGGERWALRVNPSSGNLHPTEGYLICGPHAGLSAAPILAHYAPAEHALEVRARLSDRVWQDLREGVVLARGEGLPEQSIFIGFTSILWREAWKYGDRAFRYCQHDVGHVLGALAVAASGLGWQARLLDGLSTEQVGALLGVADRYGADPAGAEPEHPDCLAAVCPSDWNLRRWQVPESVIDIFSRLALQGEPNVLSSGHVEWRWAEAAAEIVGKPAEQGSGVRSQEPGGRDQATGISDQETRVGSETHLPMTDGVFGSLRRILHRRRSAMAMDGQTHIDSDAFYRVLARTLPRPGAAPFAMLPWSPRVHLAVFVHRVNGTPPGLYLLVRDPGQVDALRAALKPEFTWEAPAGCPPGLPLYRLAGGDLRGIAQRIACGQDIAADGCFSLAMLAEFERPLSEHGAWLYPRLYWECGMIGQVLYLEAEAAGLRGTGIGCFFDDGMHGLLGLRGRQYQDLYHFTVGGPVDDPRLTTLPAYAGVGTLERANVGTLERANVRRLERANAGTCERERLAIP
jgi:SagB-type dehydrogenase family enzyme